MSQPYFELPDRLEAHQSDISFDWVLQYFQQAAARVPAYKEFLRQNNIKPETVKTLSDYAQIPPLTKQDYIQQNDLKDLVWDGEPGKFLTMPMSSGTSGVPNFWPTGLLQDQVSGLIMEPLLRKIFKADKKRVLFVNSFAYGTWKAGLEVHEAVRQVALRGCDITITSPSIGKEDAISHIKRLKGYYDSIIIAGYPPFAKDIVELGIEEGVKWKTLDVQLLTAGESISQRWREHVGQLLGAGPRKVKVWNFYGMAESGILAHETPQTISLRMRSEKDEGLLQLIGGPEAVSLHQYNPAVRYFEVGEDSQLLLTAPAGIPLIRYATRDRGGLIDGKALAEDKDWQLPFLYLYGRKDMSATIYAVGVYIENIKAAIELPKVASYFSGLFTLATEYDHKMDQILVVRLELAKGQRASADLREKITSLLVQQLRKLNREYNRLYESVGHRAEPQVELLNYGAIKPAPGKKHRWVQKD